MVGFREHSYSNIVEFYRQAPDNNKNTGRPGSFFSHISLSEFLTLIVSISVFTLIYTYFE